MLMSLCGSWLTTQFYLVELRGKREFKIPTNLFFMLVEMSPQLCCYPTLRYKMYSQRPPNLCRISLIHYVLGVVLNSADIRQLRGRLRPRIIPSVSFILFSFTQILQQRERGSCWECHKPTQ